MRTPTPPPTLSGLAPTDTPLPRTMALSSDQDRSWSRDPSRWEDVPAPAPAGLPNPFPDAAAASAVVLCLLIASVSCAAGEKAAMQESSINEDAVLNMLRGGGRGGRRLADMRYEYGCMDRIDGSDGSDGSDRDGSDGMSILAVCTASVASVKIPINTSCAIIKSKDDTPPLPPQQPPPPPISPRSA